MKLRAVPLVALAAAALGAAEPAVEFSGVLTIEGKTRIALTDRNNKTTTWVEPGDALSDGYVLDRYDPKEEAIFLKKSGQETRLGLVPSKTPDTPAASRSAAASTAPVSPAPTPLPVVPPAVSSTAATSATAPAPVASTTPSTPAATPPATPPAPDSATNPTPAPSTAADPSNVAANPATSTPASPTDTSTDATNLATATTSAPDTTPTGRPTARSAYIVQGGDTLDGIALTHGVTVQQLRQLNPSLNSNSLRAGETLRIR